ncbi:MAG: hypothetical protein K8R58_04555, partial [Bacteroidales bacterium]|nr:hypothetical protein [Bacteroidales bacterium]
MKKNYLKFIALLFASIIVLFSCSKDDDEKIVPEPESDEVIITDNGEGTGTTTWTGDKIYILDGLVFVNNGQTLTIEAGTVIKGKPGTGENASALIVARGGKINAVGTAD